MFQSVIMGEGLIQWGSIFQSVIMGEGLTQWDRPMFQPVIMGEGLSVIMGEGLIQWGPMFQSVIMGDELIQWGPMFQSVHVSVCYYPVGPRWAMGPKCLRLDRSEYKCLMISETPHDIIIMSL